MAKSERFPGFAARLTARMKELGYVRPDGKLDAQRLMVALNTSSTNIYNWLNGAAFPQKNLERLAQFLSVTPAELLYGEATVTEGKPVVGHPMLDAILAHARSELAPLYAHAAPETRQKIHNHLMKQISLIAELVPQTAEAPAKKTRERRR